MLGFCIPLWVASCGLILYTFMGLPVVAKFYVPLCHHIGLYLIFNTDDILLIPLYLYDNVHVMSYASS